MSELRKAASTVISMTPDSSSYERVFSVLKGMHAYAQDNILSDQSGITIDTFQRSSRRLIDEYACKYS